MIIAREMPEASPDTVAASVLRDTQVASARVPEVVRRKALALAALNWRYPENGAQVVAIYHDGCWWPGLSRWRSQQMDEFERRLPEGPVDGGWLTPADAYAAAGEALGLEPDPELIAAFTATAQVEGEPRQAHQGAGWDEGKGV